MLVLIRCWGVAWVIGLSALPAVAQSTTADDSAAPQEVAAGQASSSGPVVTASVPDLSGDWTGSWCSTTNGHHGPMTATFCRLDDHHYRVHFRGRYFRLLPFSYTAVLTVTGHEGDRVLLSGSHRLGPIMGTFSYNASATDAQFVAGYCSRNDQGQFVLNRCR
uniref:Uncharacterized protein n=1 Tax=Schlesneria paludicola TaxID=360056 RepID=A0A7C4QT04_9PLAN